MAKKDGADYVIMICYRDMAYCSDSEKSCGNTNCHRYITDNVIMNAATIKLPLNIMSFAARCPIFQPINGLTVQE